MMSTESLPSSINGEHNNDFPMIEEKALQSSLEKTVEKESLKTTESISSEISEQQENQHEQIQQEQTQPKEQDNIEKTLEQEQTHGHHTQQEQSQQIQSSQTDSQKEEDLNESSDSLVTDIKQSADSLVTPQKRGRGRPPKPKEVDSNGFPIVSPPKAPKTPRTPKTPKTPKQNKTIGQTTTASDDIEQTKYEKGLSNSIDEEIGNFLHQTVSSMRPKRASTINAKLITQMQINGTLDQSDNEEQDTVPTVSSTRGKRSKELGSSTSSLQSLSSSSGNINSSDDHQQLCFVCNQQVTGDMNDFNMHLDKCLEGNNHSTIASKRGRGRPPKSQSNNINSNNSNKRKIEEDDFSDLPPGAELYEIGGQTRIRTSSLLQNGYEGMVTKPRDVNDENLSLDIEEDDTVQYGEVQYTEDSLKKIKQPSLKHLNNNTTTTTTTTTTNGNVNNVNNSNGVINNNAIIEALKERIREQDKLLQNVPNCLVCMSNYQVPLASIKCWHVHCEQCWLNALKAKKWCPQCNIITTPSELRKIYL